MIVRVARRTQAAVYANTTKAAKEERRGKVLCSQMKTKKGKGREGREEEKKGREELFCLGESGGGEDVECPMEAEVA